MKYSCDLGKTAGRLIIFLLLASMPFALQAAPGNSRANTSAKAFVQSFYDWYTGKLQQGNAEELALKVKRSAFDPNLASALGDDLAASAKSPDEIVGIDFDPFLNSQDPCQRYEVGGARQDGGNYLVEVFGICDGKKDTKPDVVVEVAPNGGTWVLVNFRYPDTDDLLKQLKMLKEAREKPSN